MHLIEPLVTGIRGAESGTVYFYRRGTETFITYYTSYEGDGATTPDTGVALDTNGGGVFYVNETCTVVVRDSGGTELRTFVAGPNASAIELISQSFTGADYASGQTGASKPLALKTALDRLYTSFGALDFNVLVAGVSTSLQQAFATVGVVFINVKSTAYGAVGDGVANDTSAIQAALDAASSAGGGTVFFPAGTYKTTATLTVAAKVSLLGAGPAASRIALADGSASTLTMAASVTDFTSVTGLRIGPSQANTASAILATAGRWLRVDNCLLGNTFSSQSSGISYDATGTMIFVLNSTFDMDTSNGFAVSDPTGTTTATCHVWGCKVRFNGANTGQVFSLIKGSVLGTFIDGAAKTSGATTVFAPAIVAGGLNAALGIAFNTVTNPTGGTFAAVTAATAAASFDGLVMIGNRYGSAVTQVAAPGLPSKTTYFGVHNLQRERGRYYTADDTAAVEVNPGAYGLAEVERTTNGAQTCTLKTLGSNGGPACEDFILVYNNLTQGVVTGTITMGGEVSGLTNFTVNANRYSVYFFKAVHYAALRRWVLASSQVNLA